MPRIAISYRRDDSAAVTGRIFDRLVAHYGVGSVFRDIDNIPLGVDFREHINTMLSQTDITLVIVGKRWSGPQPRRRRRIDDPADPVRVEVETALRNGMPVVPVLVEGAAMPNAEQLPDSLKELVYRNGLEVDSGRDFDQHIERLIRSMEPILARRAEELAEGDGQRAEAARLAEEQKRRAEAAQQAEKKKRRAEAEKTRAQLETPSWISQLSRRPDSGTTSTGSSSFISERPGPFEISWPVIKPGESLQDTLEAIMRDNRHSERRNIDSYMAKFLWRTEQDRTREQKTITRIDEQIAKLSVEKRGLQKKILTRNINNRQEYDKITTDMYVLEQNLKKLDDEATSIIENWRRP
jgi:TIR domain